MRKHFLSLFLLFTASILFSQTLTVKNLRCENKTNPLGLEQLSPRMSWELESDQRSVLQSAYRILVSDNIATLDQNTGNIWDSKKINSSSSIQVAYAGKKLVTAKTYFWKVMIWDNKKKCIPLECTREI